MKIYQTETNSLHIKADMNSTQISMKQLIFFMIIFSSLPFFVDSLETKSVIIHSIPKCGTHLSHRLIHLLTGKQVFHLPLSMDALNEAKLTNKILRIFQDYEKKHIFFLRKHNYKVLAICRDVRDALISHLFYMRELKGDSLQRDFFTVSENFDSLSLEEQLSALITGTPDMQSYLDFYMAKIGWALNSHTLMVKYEDLLPQEGGGSDVRQRSTIVNVANYIGLTLTEDTLTYVIDNLYIKEVDVVIDEGVFVRASRENWRTFFTPEQKKLVKNKCGDLLIRLGYEKNRKW